MKMIGWFTTARGPGSFNLFSTMMASIKSGEIDAKLSFIFINRDVKGNQYRQRMIDIAKDEGIPVIIFPSDTFRPDLKEKDMATWREAYGEGLRERISQYHMDFGVLAGYMLIIDPETCRHHTLINLHPALPDTYKGTWEEIVGQVVENNDPSYGSTVHLCTAELDRGETLAYDSFPLAGLRSRIKDRDELVKAVRAEELKREAHLLMESIKSLVDGELVVKGGAVYDRKGRKVEDHPDLASRIDSRLRR
ncbi:MAG: phosphoribosylglycinamide formyltransferase [Methanomassiliicoccales archaeon PtaU1.Bin124]|nr:MAG: phosphoribosylglycinamide formyltransferase [Methanomassiliicoccales archaeon PtaU1.Bin124]